MYVLDGKAADVGQKKKFTHYSNSKTFFRDAPETEEHYLAHCYPSEEEAERIMDEASGWGILHVYDVGRQDGYDDNSQLVQAELSDISFNRVVIKDGHFAGVVSIAPPRCDNSLDPTLETVALTDHKSVYTKPFFDHYLIEMPVKKGIYLASFGHFERRNLEIKWQINTYYLVKKP
ncbi:MAG: hypothetical protein E7647_08485 [Ruminococcaceae bacterium]|nr:hypothetical protein [Oscillospiraceae bacterium]